MPLGGDGELKSIGLGMALLLALIGCNGGVSSNR